MTNLITILAAHSIPLTDSVLLDAYEWSLEQEGDVKDLLQEDLGDALVATILAKGS